MSTNFPNSLDNSTSLPYPTATNDTNAPSLAAGQDNQNDAVIAAQTKIGTGSSTPTANTILIGNGTGTSTWGTISGSFTTGSSGTGNFVLANSPTISNAIISSPTIIGATFSGSIGSISTGSVTATGLVTSNGGLTVTGPVSLPNSIIKSTNLALSSGFAQGVTSYSNTASAGGTFYYINLGGLKMLWGNTAVRASYNSPFYQINFPAGFFNSIQSMTVSPTDLVADEQQSSNIQGINVSLASIYFFSVTNSSNAQQSVYVYVIGT